MLTTQLVDYLDPTAQRAARSQLESGKGANCNDPRILGLKLRKLLQPQDTRADDVGGVSSSQGLKTRPGDRLGLPVQIRPCSFPKLSPSIRRSWLRRPRSLAISSSVYQSR